MFEHLSDPNPPEPDAGARALVGRRAQKIHRRTQVTRAVVLTAVMVVLAGGVLAAGHRGGSDAIKTAAPNETCCGAITGTIHRADNGPANKATVQLMQTSPKVSTTKTASGVEEAPYTWLVKGTPATTDSAGNYHFDGLEAGDYIIRVSNFLKDDPSFIGDGSTPVVPVASGAKVIHVTSGRTDVENWTLHTSSNSKITGSVRAGNYAIVGIRVRLYIGGELSRVAVTDEKGNYDLGGVPSPGSYTLAFVDENEARMASGKTYATQWYKGGDHAEPFAVPSDGLAADMVLVPAKK